MYVLAGYVEAGYFTPEDVAPPPILGSGGAGYSVRRVTQQRRDPAEERRLEHKRDEEMLMRLVAELYESGIFEETV
jgi:hypothetical protein